MKQLRFDSAHVACKKAYAKLDAHCERCPICHRVKYENGRFHELCSTGQALSEQWTRSKLLLLKCCFNHVLP